MFIARTKHLYGFRPSHSTIHPIIQLRTTASMQKTHVHPNIHLQYPAFDVLQPDILPTKHYNLRIRGTAHKWMINYRSNNQNLIHGNRSDHLTSKNHTVQSTSGINFRPPPLSHLRRGHTLSNNSKHSLTDMHYRHSQLKY